MQITGSLKQSGALNCPSAFALLDEAAIAEKNSFTPKFIV
jgi:hypothetical protein